MKYLGIDLGTTYTKCVIFDTERTDSHIKVELNSSQADFGFGKTKYAMPTAVLVDVSREERTYEVGTNAVNRKLYPGTFFFDNFKPELDYQEEDKCYDPVITYVEILSAIFSHVYTCAKLQSLSDFDRVVITVPASTVKNGPRWNKMEKAARNVFSEEISIDIILEPEAAGYALLKERLKEDGSINNKSFIIYDFGGGTFDTSIFKVIDEQIFIVGESVGSDEQTKLGGIYIDDLLRRDYISNGNEINKRIEILEKTSDLRLRLDTENLIREEPIRAKISMSNKDRYNYSLNDYCLTKSKFNSLIHPIIEETMVISTNLLKSKEEDGESLSLKDIHSVFLVGGSSKINMVSSSWKDVHSLNNCSFDIIESDLEIVALGAAMYNYVRVSKERLVELGLISLDQNEYNKAALYFRNAENADGYTLLGMLYYEGLIGNKCNYAKAVKYFKLSNNEDANLMLAKCAFHGRQGLPRNHELAKEYLKNAGQSNLAKKLEEALSSSPSSSTLNYIYDYSPLKEILSSYDVESLRLKYMNKDSIDRTNDTIDSINEDDEDVKPCHPDLNYLDLMRRAENLFKE